MLNLCTREERREEREKKRKERLERNKKLPKNRLEGICPICGLHFSINNPRREDETWCKGCDSDAKYGY